MQTLLYSIKNYLYRLNQARRRTYLDKQRRRIKYFLIGKIRALIVWGGVWLIAHSPFLKKEIKILFKDFKDYYALKQTLVSNLHSAYFIENLNTIKVWLYSKEFKENYQDKNHPYPSLLNPEKIDYENIPAELAWEMNVPLKQCDMVKFTSHGTGNTFDSFIGKLNINTYSSDRKREKEIYIYCFNASSFQDKTLLTILEYYPSLKGKKLYALIPTPKIKTLNQVRDPISMLKAYMSMKRPKTEDNKIINLTYNTKEYLANLIGYSAIEGLKSYPSLENIEGWINFRVMCFHDTLLYNALININEVEFMDMSEIVGERTFETMKRFAKEFNVAEPKEEDREYFERKSSDFAYLLPTLYIHNDDLEKINTNDDSSLSKEGGIHLYLLKKFFIEENIHKDITNEILSKEDISQIDIIRVAIKCEDEEKYKEIKADTKLFNRTKIFVKELIENILEQEKIENSKKLTENDVLDYLRKDKKLRKKFKKVLDEEHLALIKERRPDIVASWKYYQEFERMCEKRNR